MTAQQESIAPAGELYVPHLMSPWAQPTVPVVVIEDGPDLGTWSVYRLPGGRVVALMPAVEPTWTTEQTLTVLVRAIANLTQVCPSCGARASLGGADVPGRPRATMEHEAVCPVGDDGLREVAARPGAAVGPLPDRPRRWAVWPPRLRPGYRPRRFTSEPKGRNRP
jgi:hypothetical protein